MSDVLDRQIDVFDTKANSSLTHGQRTASPGHPSPVLQTGWICRSFSGFDRVKNNSFRSDNHNNVRIVVFR